MTPTDAAIAHAFRENAAENYWDKSARWENVREVIERRARELDAEKGGEVERGQFYVCPICHGPGMVTQATHDKFATPPAQAAESVQVASNPGAILSKDAEAVERVARAAALASSTMVGYDTELFWSFLDERAREHWRIVARAAIAAMQAGEGK